MTLIERFKAGELPRPDFGRSPWFPTVYVQPVFEPWGEDFDAVWAFLSGAWADLGEWACGVRIVYATPPRRPWDQMAHTFFADLSWKRAPNGQPLAEHALDMRYRPQTIGTDMAARGIFIDPQYHPSPQDAALALAHGVQHSCGMPANPHPAPGKWTPAMTRAGSEMWYGWCGPDWELYREMLAEEDQT